MDPETSSSTEEQYTALQIAGIWFAATLPPIGVAWVVVPRLIAFPTPAVSPTFALRGF
jgi:hypothetical protein